MSFSTLSIYLLKFFVPTFCFAFLFRAIGLGYKSKKRLILGTAVYFLYMAIVPAFLILKMGYGQFTHISSIVMLTSVCSIFIFTTDTIPKTIFFILFASQINTVVSVVLNLIRTIYKFSYLSLVVAIVILCPIILYFMLKYLTKPAKFIGNHIYSEIYSLIAIEVITMVIIYIIPVYPAENFSKHPLFCSFLMISVEMLSFIFIYTLYKNLKLITSFMKREHKQELLKQELSHYDEFLENAKLARHDLRHHNAVLLGYLDNNNIAEAKQYLEENQDALSNTKLKEYCTNKIANLVLIIYEKECEKNAIDYVVNAQLAPTLPLSNNELAALLSNLLENAVTALNEIKEGERKLYISLNSSNDVLKIKIANNYNGKRIFSGDLPKTTKIDGGYGTKSVKQIVDKYKGMLNFNASKELFTVHIVIPLG